MLKLIEKTNHSKQMKVIVFIFATFIISGCSNLIVHSLATYKLDKLSIKGKYDKIAFYDLPIQVQDTIQGSWEWYVTINKDADPCGFMRKYFENLIILDSTVTLSKRFSVGPYPFQKDGGRFFDNGGDHFSLNKRAYNIPLVSDAGTMIIFNCKLYIMGDASKAKPFIQKCDDINSLVPDYKGYLYWVLPIRKCR